MSQDDLAFGGVRASARGRVDSNADGVRDDADIAELIAIIDLLSP